MPLEFLGFLTGIGIVGVVWFAFVKHEWWKAVSSAYGKDQAKSGSSGNALIWPSH